MPQGWQWDETLFRGSARFYERGRLPYPPALAGAVAGALGLDGRGRLLDVGCGPGTVALRLAHLFEAVVGLDADADMLAEAERRAAELGIVNARWAHALAETLPAGLGAFRVATFAASFHWMDRGRVASAILSMLEPGGAFVQVSAWPGGPPDPDRPLPHPLPPREAIAGRGCGTSVRCLPRPHPLPPREAIAGVIRRYLGPVRRAGQGVLLYGTPGDEADVLRRAGFDDPEIVQVPGREVVMRTVDDLIAAQYSTSSSAPHLFGGRLAGFEAELRALLAAASPSGLFAEQTGDVEVRVWRKPPR